MREAEAKRREEREEVEEAEKREGDKNVDEWEVKK